MPSYNLRRHGIGVLMARGIISKQSLFWISQIRRTNILIFLVGQYCNFLDSRLEKLESLLDEEDESTPDVKSDSEAAQVPENVGKKDSPLDDANGILEENEPMNPQFKATTSLKQPPV